MTKLTMKTVTCCVKMRSETSHKFQTSLGVRIGDARISTRRHLTLTIQLFVDFQNYVKIFLHEM